MKVLLVRPKYGIRATYPAFSLIAIAPYFNGEVQLCDLQSNTRLHHWLTKDTDLVGFTCFSNQLTEVDDLAEQVQKTSKTKTIAGGPGITVNPEYAKEMLPNVDLLVAGDGEFFASDWNNILKIPDLKIYKPPYRYCWTNHKVPAWDLIDCKPYYKFPGAAVETSRGCPFNCCFCCAHLITGKQWRPREPESVVHEIRYLKETYGFGLFYFPDDNATVDPKRWVTLMQQIGDADLGVTLHAPEGIQAHHLNRESLLLMQKSGFKSITIGAESGVQRVLDKVIDKGGLKVEQTENVVRLCSEIGMEVNCFFVIGIVGETLDEAEQTVGFAEKLRALGAHSCSVRNAIPIPGTRMFNIALEKGYLTVPVKELYNQEVVHSGVHLLETPEWNPEQIEALVRKDEKQNLRSMYKRYSVSEILAKTLRHPVQSLKKALRSI